MPNQSLSALEAQVGETHETIHGLDIEAGKVAEFAHSIHDPAGIYLDEEAAMDAGFDTIPAPPTFHRVSYFPRYRPPGIDEEFGFDLGLEREYVLHGQQRYRYERPMLVGDRLRGETTLEDVFQRSGQSGGTMTFAILRTDLYDHSDSLVLQAWNTRIETDGPPGDTTGGPPTGSIEGVSEASTSGGFDVGDAGHVVETPELERRDFVTYAGASGDFNPIHYDEPYATGAGHPSVFGQGMFSAGIASKFVRQWFGLDSLSSFRTRFSARVFPGESLVVRGVVTEIESVEVSRTVDIDFEVTTVGENKLVVEGSASAVVEE